MLAQAGAFVIGVDRSDELVDDTRDRLAGYQGGFLGITADLRDRKQVDTIIPKVRAEIGHLDLVANVAGGTQRGQFGPLELTPDQVYDDTFALNLDYVFRVCRDAGRLMIESGKGGAIVNVASVSGLLAAPFHGPYGAAKSGVVALTQTMAIEWGRFGIRANVVAPGSVRTPRSEATKAPLDERARAWAPLQRPVEKEDIASAILFLLSDAARSITGQLLNVDCGVSSRCPIGGLEVFGVQFLGNQPPAGRAP
jgi:NAD(P)-dependent dehydrogenase (short-subunit alcohol dehydrogenase family)